MLISEPGTYTLTGSLKGTVYVDGVETRCIRGEMGTQSFSNAGGYDHYIESLPTAGTHTIQWVYHNTHSSSYQTAKVLNIICVAAPLIEVNLLEAGSLGTEVLYNVDHVKDVKRLKVSGPMNSDDWARIQMMTNLFELDMKDAITDAVPANQFDGSSTASAKMYLQKVILPDVLKTINNYAFRYTHVEEVVFPSASQNQQVILQQVRMDYLDVQRAGVFPGMSLNRHLFKGGLDRIHHCQTFYICRVEHSS